MKPVLPKLNFALCRDLERRLGTDDLIEWLETEAERVASLGRKHGGPIAFSTALLRDRNISLIGAKPYLPALQTISPTENGYEIRYTPFQRVEDRRFGVAHEIAHTFWFGPGAGGNPLSPLQRAIGDDPTIEWLCNRAAAAILLPRSDLTPITEEVPLVLHKISNLAKLYVVPERLVARRIFHDLAGKDVDLLAVRRRGDKGKVAWFASAPSRGQVMKKLENRTVPSELLPTPDMEKTCEVKIDGRWCLLADSASGFNRAKPLKRSPQIQPTSAWVFRNEDTWYVALPRQNRQSSG